MYPCVKFGVFLSQSEHCIALAPLLYIAVMNNFTHFGQMGHLRAIIISWDHQLSIEYNMYIV